jgi:hypothetical protein
VKIIYQCKYKKEIYHTTLLVVKALKVFEFFGQGPIKVAHCKKEKEEGKKKERRSDILV